MAEEGKTDRNSAGTRVKGMSLYAASADYERRLSEVDCVSELEPDTAEEPPRDVG